MTERRTIIHGGVLFDGSGGEGRPADVLIEGDRVASIAPHGSIAVSGAERVDATGCWLTPGFVDLHTHYDAEVEIAPALGESIRHGVTTVMVGSCGLSMAVGEPEDLADMFCRVEGIPRSTVAPLFHDVKDWDDPAGYLAHLGKLALGPNVCAMIGHSTIRARAMGLGPSVTRGRRPSADEMRTMEALLRDALDAGYLGMSINTLPWDKLDGERHRSQPTPSVFGSWREYRRLTRILRERGRVFQGVPNLVTKLNLLLFALESVGIGRRTLKTTFIALIDAKSSRSAAPLAALLLRICNRFLRANVRIQALPHPFDMWSDGLEVPVLEEIGAGTEALHLVDPTERSRLLADPAFRRRFRRQWSSAMFGKAFHRDLDQTEIVAAPDPSIVGRSFGDVARERGKDSIETFLDLQSEHGNALRWYSVIGNDRPDKLAWILTRPDILVGFSDAGAHLRNMGFYNFPLRMLRQVRVAEQRGEPFMTIGEAVRRLTSEIADWLEIDAGHVREGGRADLVAIDPDGLDEAVDALHERDMPGFPGLRRLVRRNDRAVRGVWIAGRRAVAAGEPLAEVGRERAFGRVLTAAGAP